MSAFIGPIHYWLYGKIKLVVKREEAIFNKANEMCAGTAEEIREQVWQTYGTPLADIDLSELIDHENIHGWLQRQIKVAETREAAFIKELLTICGDTAQKLIAETFMEQGQLAGDHARASNKYELSTASDIYKALNDYYLNGMPCDQGDRVVKREASQLIWEGACLQAPNWKRAGTDSNTMMNFYFEWIKAFVRALNPEYSVKYTNIASDGGNRFEFYR